MKSLINVLILMIFSSVCIQAVAEDVSVLKGRFESKSRTSKIKTFEVSKGDVLDIKITCDHKKRGIDFWIKQHPGDIVVLDFEEMNNGAKTIVAPADAIYEVFCGNERVEFDIDIINHTNKPNGPNRGGIVYVQMPDTLHASGYVAKKVGESYSLTPYTEKVVLGTTIQSENVCNRDFFTGVDMIKLSLPGDVKEDYREQKLLSYNVSLICQSPGIYDAMLGVVDAGVDSFVPDIGVTDVVGKVGKSGKNKNSVEKMNQNHMYEFTDNLEEKSSKMEHVPGLVSLGAESSGEFAPGSGADAGLQTAAFLLDTDGMKELALEEGLKAVGAPKEMKAIIDGVNQIPSTTDLLKDGIHTFAPKVKGSAVINVRERYQVQKPYYKFADQEFWIQSAMNVGQNAGGCWDIPGKPSTSSNGQNLECWDIDGGVDRKFKIVPSKTHEGYYHIVTALPGDKQRALDNSGGSTRLDKNGNNLLLWDKHEGTSQMFRFEDVGEGKFKIINYYGYIVCLSGRKNKNGTNIHIWEPHSGPHTEWCLVDPALKTKYTAATVAGNSMVWGNYLKISKRGGAISETVEVGKPEGKLFDNMPTVELSIEVLKDLAEAKSKLIVEAKYRITDYTDVIKYARTTEMKTTNDFWTAYKVNYNYAIMFKDQTKDYYKIMNESEYNSSSRPVAESSLDGGAKQADRLRRYGILTAPKK